LSGIPQSLSLIAELQEKKTLFHEAHFILALHTIFRRGHTGRYPLVEELCLQSSRARILLKLMQESGVIVTSIGRKGAQLTLKGQEICNELFGIFHLLETDDDWNIGGILTLGDVNSLVAIPFGKLNTKSLDLIGIRDAAVRCGGLGATVLVGVRDGGNLVLNFYKRVGDFGRIDPDLDQESVLALKDLGRQLLIVSPNLEIEDKWIFIAGTSNYSVNRSLDGRLQIKSECKAKTLSILAAVQAAWECVFPR